MVVWLISVWAIAVFGFHFLLRAIEKPTPEPQLIAFNQVWENVKTGNYTPEELTTFAQSALHVTGKVFIAPEHRQALDNGITWALFELADSAQQVALKEALHNFEQVSDRHITDEAYATSKKQLAALAHVVIDLNPNGVLTDILPQELTSKGIETFSEKNKTVVEACMPLYMTHNQSVLTDTTFLGFPFHYFYSAVFLLILFIGLCYAYCVRLDRYHKIMEISE
jgi:putative solute:sodium symporter small subunit